MTQVFKFLFTFTFVFTVVLQMVQVLFIWICVLARTGGSVLDYMCRPLASFCTCHAIESKESLACGCTVLDRIWVL